MRILGVTASSILKVTSSYESIATATGTGSSGTITFTSIPSTYKHLEIRVIAFNTTGGALTAQINSDTGANYARHRLVGNGSTVTAAGTASTTNIYLAPQTADMDGTNPLVSILNITDYASTTKNKTFRSLGGIDKNNTTGKIELVSGLWMNTSAITSISISGDSGGNFTTNSTFALYGIKG
jgi:hypothetical protein